MMLEIKAVEQDSKDRHRYHIYIDDGDPILTVHEDLLIRHRLLKGQTISKSAIAEISNEDERYRAYTLAIVYLSYKAQTSKQIKQYLRRKEFGEEHISYALERLESEHLVDDEEYARQFTKQRVRSGQKGSRWIKQELQQRGVSKEAAAEATAAIDPDDERLAAQHAAAKKWRSLKGETADKRRKLIAFLMRRGFPGDVIKAAVKSAMEDVEMDEAEDEDRLLLDN